MLRSVNITKIKHYLTVLGLEHCTTKDGFEGWESSDKFVIICVSENEMPPFAITVMLKELEETVDSFLRITSVIN